MASANSAEKNLNTVAKLQSFPYRNDGILKVNKTSGQSNLTKSRIAAAHERFSRIRQVAPMRTHI